MRRLVFILLLLIADDAGIHCGGNLLEPQSHSLLFHRALGLINELHHIKSQLLELHHDTAEVILGCAVKSGLGAVFELGQATTMCDLLLQQYGDTLHRASSKKSARQSRTPSGHFTNGKWVLDAAMLKSWQTWNSNVKNPYTKARMQRPAAKKSDPVALEFLKSCGLTRDEAQRVDNGLSGFTDLLQCTPHKLKPFNLSKQSRKSILDAIAARGNRVRILTLKDGVEAMRRAKGQDAHSGLAPTIGVKKLAVDNWTDWRSIRRYFPELQAARVAVGAKEVQAIVEKLAESGPRATSSTSLEPGDEVAALLRRLGLDHLKLHHLKLEDLVLLEENEFDLEAVQISTVCRTFIDTLCP
jgi:hypothetical protein